MTEAQNPMNPINSGETSSAPEGVPVAAQPTQQIPHGYAAQNAAACDTSAYQQPQATSMPPAYNVATYQPAAPVAYVPQLTQLTGGQKFGWFIVGFLGNIIGMLLAWLVNIDKAPQVKSDAIKFSVIGFVVAIVLDVILFVFMGMAMTAFTAGLIDSLDLSSYYY